MSILFYLTLTSTIGYVLTIDGNEKIGTCISKITTNDKHYINALEGIWFPQYRSSSLENQRYSCHISYGEMLYEDNNHTLRVTVFYTFDGQIEIEPSVYEYKKGPKRGVLMDEEFIEGIGHFYIFNYIIKMTDDYIVRYVCTNYIHKEYVGPTFYVETRQMVPTLEIITEAVKAINLLKCNVTLEKIVQNGCIRPLSVKGYNDSGEQHHDN